MNTQRELFMSLLNHVEASQRQEPSSSPPGLPPGPDPGPVLHTAGAQRCPQPHSLEASSHYGPGVKGPGVNEPQKGSR